MKKILLMVLLILSITSISFADELPSSTDFVLSIIPYDGGVNVDLGSRYYARHSADVEWKENIDDTFIPDENNKYYSPYYTNDHIVAIGGAANIEIQRETDIPTLGLYGVWIPKNGVSLEVTATCDTNFEFVSQSNPIYRRPFEIEILPRARTTYSTDEDPYETNNPYTKEVHTLNSTNSGCTIDLTTSSNQTNIGSISGNYRITMLAADLVLVLPFDYTNTETGGYFSGGLSYNNATYALADLSDYTAVVNFTITLRINYYQNYESEDNTGALSTKELTRTLTIPFSGYYSSNNIGVSDDDSISLYVNPTNEAANLNLENQGEWITIGNIQFLYNDSNPVSNQNAGKDSSEVLSNSDVVRIFLSSSPHPSIEGSAFRMVHEDASSVITNTNSLGFTARIQGTGENNGDISLNQNANYVDFDGTSAIKTLSTLEDTTGDDAVITTCHIEAPANVIKGYGYRHFHTFEGDIQIRFDRSDMLQAGIYRGYVYVHAITEDENKTEDEK